MKYLFSLLLTVLIFASKAQISGFVTDIDNNSLPGAAVALLQNGTIVSGTTTNPKGAFSLKAAPGTYTLEISFIAYETYSQKITVAAKPQQLGSIQLKPGSTSLEEVTVEGEANLVEFRQDKRIYNVAKDLNSAGTNASEVLNNLPSVDVDIDGNVSLRGSQNVRILIDGRPSGLIGTDPANALRSLQSSMIEKVEVITNPSARYEAEGEAGIINIVLKKERESGLNGNFQTSVGYPELYGGAAGLNYRSGRLNLFTNLGFNYNKNPGGGYTNQTFTLADTSYAFNSKRHQERAAANATLRFGADYNLTDNQILTGTFLYSPSNGDNLVRLTYDDFDENGILTQTQIREDTEEENRTTLEGNLHYEKQLKGKDHKWTADMRYQNSDDRESSDILQYTQDSNDELLQKVRNQEDEQNLVIRTDYVHPFSKKKSFELGARASWREIINNFSVRQANGIGGFDLLDRYTNNFNYQENIYAAYAIYNGAFQRITYQVGLRGEYTGITTELVKENRTNPREYFNLFPSLFLTWDINKLSDLQWSYSRRISRPGFRSLLPFFSFSDNRNFYSGNPDLNPEFTDSYELGYLRYLGKATLYSGFYYRHRTGVVERIRTVNDTGFTEIFPVNLAIQDAYGLEITYTHPVNSWLRLNANFNLYQAVNTGSYNEIDYGFSNFSSRGRISGRFSFWKSDTQLSLNYRAPSTTAQGTAKAVYMMDIAWSKDLLKGDATLTFNVRDLFNSRKRRGFSEGDNFTSEYEFQWRSRQFTLSFAYRLNQKKQRQRNEKEFGEGEDFGI